MNSKIRKATAELIAKNFKVAASLLLAIIMLLDTAPLELIAHQSAPRINTSARMLPPYIYVDGEPHYVGERPAIVSRVRNTALPPVSDIVDIPVNYIVAPSVTMSGTAVSALRYIVRINGQHIEAFCANPTQRGPENPAASYDIVSEGSSAFLNALRYGFSANPLISDPGLVPDMDERMHWAYVTRVAIAMAQNTNATFTGNDTDTMNSARDLNNGHSFFTGEDFNNTRPAIALNGVRHAEDLNRTVTSTTAASTMFNVTYYRRFNDATNRFRFEWSADTPTGARLIVDGAVVATAPVNPDTIFGYEPYIITSFHIEMDVTTANEGREAKVYLVGVNNQWSNRVWLMQNTVNPADWQDIVFYIPYIRSSAVFSFELAQEPPTDPPTTPPTTTPPITTPPPRPDTEVTIQKICAIGRHNIPGALMRLRGMSSHQVVTGDGQLWEIDNTGINVSQVLTVGATTAVPTGVTSTITRDGVWHLTGLPYGFYLVEEERAPDGFSLYPQHTAFGFWVLPPNVHIDSPDGVVYNIVERGPNENHILITFENFPFSEIVVYKREMSNGIGNNQLLPGAHIRIRGYYPGNPAIPIDRMGVTDANGRIVFDNLPAGAFTVEEVAPPSGFLLGENTVWHVNVGWGQTVARGTAQTHTFFNPPKSSLEVLKVCGITNEPLSGAIFELQDPTTGESWQATSGANGIAVFGRGSHGNFLYPNRTLILREIQSPYGFVLMEGPREVILSPGNENRVTWHNYRNPSLTIIKECQDTGRRLAGARFSIVAQGSGRPLPTDFTLVTNENGEIYIPWTLFAGENERTFIITEEVPPPGFNLATPNWQTVTLVAGRDNTILFQNRRMPDITIEKRDSRTGYPIRGAWFEVEYLGAIGGTGSGNIGQTGSLTGNPFITDSQGRIVINAVHSGVYRITEVRAANNYWLDPLAQNRTWTITVRDNEDYTLVVENTLLPTLVVTKRNALTWRPVPMTQFRIDFEVPNSPSVQHIGYFMTNVQGQIILPFVQMGWYRVVETRPAPGMTLASNNSFRVFLQPGDNSYALMREGIIASESMIVPAANSPAAPPASSEPAFEPDENGREYLPSGNSNNSVANAPTPDIPNDAELDAIEPDLDAIAVNGLAPEQSSPTNSSYLPDIPDFENIDLENIEITLVDDPALVARLTDQMQVWGGDHFWNNDLGVWNFPQNSIIIRKENAVTGEPLAGATFSLTQISSGNQSGLHGTIIGHFVTNASGIIVITGLDPSYVVVEETIPPPNFTLSTNNRQHAFLRPDGTSVVELTFSNLPYSSLLITLRCSVTSAPIPDGEFIGVCFSILYFSLLSA